MVYDLLEVVFIYFFDLFLGFLEFLFKWIDFKKIIVGFVENVLVLFDEFFGYLYERE